MYDPDILLPGPTKLPPAVVAALTHPASDHRGPEFDRVRLATLAQMEELLDAAAVAVLPSSGTGALEAAVQNFFDPGDLVLSVSVGAFGQRLRDAAKVHGLSVDALDFPWGEAFDVASVLGRLHEKAYRAVLVTQNETATGVLNPIEELARAIHQGFPGADRPLVIVDTVSGYPSVPLALREWGVDVALMGSQKGFMLPPGLAMIAVSEKGLERAQSATQPRFYFDLRPYFQKELPYTPAVSLWHALAVSLNMLQEEGAEARYRRHRLLRDLVRGFARGAGLGLPVKDAVASPTVTLLTLPEPWTPKTLRHALHERGIEVAGAMGPFVASGIRIGHLGYLSAPRLMGSLAALAAVLDSQVSGEGAGSQGLQAAMSVWNAAGSEGGQ